MPAWDFLDLTLPETTLVEETGSPQLLALTILYHPDPGRIGEVAELAPHGTDRTSVLSRREPGFAPARPTGTAPAEARPLADRYLSRSPVRFRWRRELLYVDAPSSGSSLKLDGLTCSDEQAIEPERLQAGVVLSLANRVVLLLHRPASHSPWPDDCGLVGEHPALQQLRRQLCSVAARDTPVLLLGESGTGKELLARALHERSERCDRPLVAVNVAAIPEELAAAELFGVKRGAFTGAEQDRAGYFGRADGGTLFLDEIGACTQAIQSQLLRALQQGEIQAPGGKTERVDVRIVAATDADVDGQFSKALRYRLGGVEMHLPPLRERRQDLGRLLRHFLPADFMEAAQESPAQVSLWVELLTRLALHSWPGNIRELANCARLADSYPTASGRYHRCSSQRRTGQGCAAGRPLGSEPRCPGIADLPPGPVPSHGGYPGTAHCCRDSGRRDHLKLLRVWWRPGESLAPVAGVQGGFDASLARNGSVAGWLVSRDRRSAPTACCAWSVLARRPASMKRKTRASGGGLR